MTNKNYYDVDQDAITGNPLGAEQLPFDAPFFWWVRGDPTNQDIGSGVRRFGGWACSQDANLASYPGLDQVLIPETFVSGRDGSTYDVYAIRRLNVSLIGARKRWIITRDDRAKGRKGRGAYQALCLSALYDQELKQFNYFMPIVLTTKSMTAVHLEKAFYTWNSKTAQVRQQYANNLPFYLFWATIGTVRKDIYKVTVGSGSESNYITPPEVHIPEILKDKGNEVLNARWIGKEIAALRKSYFQEAQEWLHAWDNLAEGEDEQPTSPTSYSDTEDVPF